MEVVPETFRITLSEIGGNMKVIPLIQTLILHLQYPWTKIPVINI
jgi:hypothetical protein